MHNTLFKPRKVAYVPEVSKAAIKEASKVDKKHDDRLTAAKNEIEDVNAAKADIEECHENMRMILATVRGKVAVDAPVIAKANKDLFERLGGVLKDDDAPICVLCEKVMKPDEAQKLNCHQNFCKKCWDDWR